MLHHSGYNRHDVTSWRLLSRLARWVSDDGGGRDVWGWPESAPEGSSASSRRLGLEVTRAPRRGVARGMGVPLVREVLGEPDGAGGIAEDGDADVGEGTAEDVPAVTVVGWLLVEHGLGEADRHLGDGGGGVRDRPAFADVLPGRGPVDAGGGLAGAEIGLPRALVGEPAAASHRRVMR